MHLISSWRLFESVSRDPTCYRLLGTLVVSKQITSGSLDSMNNAKRLPYLRAKEEM